jgi:hypothetical protein
MSDEWIKTLADRRRVKFTTQELDEKAFLTAQVEGSKEAVTEIELSLSILPPQPPEPTDEARAALSAAINRRSPMGLRARLARGKLAVLSRSSTASWTTDSEGLFWAKFSFHGAE